MASPPQLADRRYRANAALRTRTVRAARGMWRGLDRTRLDRSWITAGPQLAGLLTVAQAQTADSSDAYVTAVLASQDIDNEAQGTVNAVALAGTASDGRPLDSLLREPIITVKEAIGKGVAPARAMLLGQAQLEMIVSTQVVDAGRVGDGVALATRPRAGGYVRMLSGGSCGRCVILAGRFYRWSSGFLRHPRCDCRHIPSNEDVSGDLSTNPMAHFRSLSADEQDRAFTKAGAQSIREGADINQVVNARRGMYTAGGRRFTRESTTRRGAAAGRQRIMPEQIFKDAGGNREEAIRLLKLHRFIL